MKGRGEVGVVRSEPQRQENKSESSGKADNDEGRSETEGIALRMD